MQAKKAHEYATTIQTIEKYPVDAPDSIDLSIEQEAGHWQPVDVRHVTMPRPCGHRPWCMLDGKEIGRTVAWLQSRRGYLVPVRLSENGASLLQDGEGELNRQFGPVEKVVSFPVELFPWHEVEGFAASLQERGFHLLPAQLVCEQHTFDADAIMSHAQQYLHPQGWRIFCALAPGQRTPAFRLRHPTTPSVVTWYLRSDGSGGEMPNWGMVRIEIIESFISAQIRLDLNDYANYASRLLCDFRPYVLKPPTAPSSRKE